MDANWLLLGVGEMILKAKTVNGSASVSASDAMQFYESEKKRAEKAEGLLDKKEAQLDRKDEQIEALLKDVEHWRTLALKKIQVTA